MVDENSKEIDAAKEVNTHSGKSGGDNPADGKIESDRFRGRFPKELKDVPAGKRIEQRFRDGREQHRVFCVPRVEGFEKSGLVTNEEVKKYLEIFPERHCNSITMDSVKYSGEYISEKDKVELAHWEDTKPFPGMEIHHKDITINRQLPDGNVDVEVLKDSIAHEVGHQVHRVSLDRSDWNKWTMLSGDRPADKCVSDYARLNHQEDFAESYMAYVRNPESLLNVDPEKYNFMRDSVFDGREYGKGQNAARG